MTVAFVVLGAGLAIALACITLFPPPVLLRLAARLSPGVLYYCETTEKVIALTIDDGPSGQLTSEILDVLAANGAHCTFFVIGSRIPGNEAVLERAIREGHEFGNHMMRDVPSILLPRSTFAREFHEASARISEYATPRFFRPSSGPYSPFMLREATAANEPLCLGSVYPQDTKFKNRSFITWFIAHRVFPGAIVILHEGGEGRRGVVDVLRRVLPVLHDEGYEIVTVSELTRTSQQATD